MTSFFKSRGFDTIIAEGTQLLGDFHFTGTVELNGSFIGGKLAQADGTTATLSIGGLVEAERIEVENLTITGQVTTKLLIVKGAITIKKGGNLNADTIIYRVLSTEPGVIVLGTLQYLPAGADM